jgi:hypothetical protein
MMSASSTDLHQRTRAQLARVDERIATAWNEYLVMTRAGAPAAYAQTEAFAWRRLRRSLADLAGERRRLEFELDREIAESRGLRRAA